MTAEQPHQPPRPVNAFTDAPMHMLFENLQRWNEFALSVNPGDIVIQVRLADGSMFPDEVCMDTPAGGCRFCNSIMGVFEDKSEPDARPLDEDSLSRVDCIDCQEKLITEALGEPVPECTCDPDSDDADCDPACRHPECYQG